VRSGDVEFSLGFRVELTWRAPSERGCKIKLGAERVLTQTHLVLKTTANGRSSDY
jgi:hypothetical protein